MLHKRMMLSTSVGMQRDGLYDKKKKCPKLLVKDPGQRRKERKMENMEAPDNKNPEEHHSFRFPCPKQIQLNKHPHLQNSGTEAPSGYQSARCVCVCVSFLLTQSENIRRTRSALLVSNARLPLFTPFLWLSFCTSATVGAGFSQI